MKRFLFLLIALRLATVASHGQKPGGPPVGGPDLVPTITFGQSSDYTQNFLFYPLTGPPSGSPYDPSGFLTKSTRNRAANFIYDTSPDATPTNNQFRDFILEADFRAPSSEGGISLFFHSLNSRQKALAAHFSIESDNTYSLSFYSEFAPSFDYLGFLQSQTIYSGTFNTWLHMTTEVRTTGNFTSATAAVYNSQTVFTPETLIASGSFNFPNSMFAVPGEVGVSIRSNGPFAVSADNFGVSSVPEPSSAALLLLGSIAAFTMRRRRNT